MKQVSEPRFHLVVLGLFAALSLGLAALGVYGVVAQWSSSRRRELALRLALGADRSAVLGLVLRQGGVLVGVGVLAGLVVSASLVRYLEASLFRVSPSEPSVYLLATLVLTGIGLTASFVPARRAARTDPAATLRAE